MPLPDVINTCISTRQQKTSGVVTGAMVNGNFQTKFCDPYLDTTSPVTMRPETSGTYLKLDNRCDDKTYYST